MGGYTEVCLEQLLARGGHGEMLAAVTCAFGRRRPGGGGSGECRGVLEEGLGALGLPDGAASSPLAGWPVSFSDSGTVMVSFPRWSCVFCNFVSFT